MGLLEETLHPKPSGSLKAGEVEDDLRGECCCEADGGSGKHCQFSDLAGIRFLGLGSTIIC